MLFFLVLLLIFPRSPCFRGDILQFNEQNTMPGFIDITDKKKLNSLLNALHPETPALWGKMNAQNMIEHLVEAVEYTNGKRIADLQVPIEQANKEKAELVNSAFVIPKEAPGFLTTTRTSNRFKDLATAIKELHKELDAFEIFFKTEGK